MKYHASVLVMPHTTEGCLTLKCHQFHIMFAYSYKVQHNTYVSLLNFFL